MTAAPDDLRAAFMAGWRNTTAGEDSDLPADALEVLAEADFQIWLMGLP